MRKDINHQDVKTTSKIKIMKIHKPNLKYIAYERELILEMQGKKARKIRQTWRAITASLV